MFGVGIHCFAGGFTMGVKKVLPVVGQLEIHNFGRETCEAHDTKFMNGDRWQDWHDYKSVWDGASFCYGNPRCTSFSSYSAGADRSVRGPYAEPTRDIWDLCKFGLIAGFNLIAFESVQQCYTVGRELLEVLRDELFIPNNFRIAHLFVNTAAEGNAQKRRRYFFVAYRDDRNFNVMLPNLPKYQTTVGDVLNKFINRPTREGKFNGKNFAYDADSYKPVKGREKAVVSRLKEGESYTRFAKYRLEELKSISEYHYEKWIHRTSGIPFSLHAPVRLRWNGCCPTVSSTSRNFIHPRRDRPLTVRELAALMGWPKNFIPVGQNPIAQIGKGVVPATGEWFAEQIKLYLEDFWKDEDFESSYNNKSKRWVGNTFAKTNKPIEKIFRLTNYIPPFKETSNV